MAVIFFQHIAVFNPLFTWLPLLQLRSHFCVHVAVWLPLRSLGLWGSAPTRFKSFLRCAFLNLQDSTFHQFWKILSHCFFGYYLSHLSLLSLQSSNYIVYVSATFWLMFSGRSSRSLISLAVSNPFI